MLILLTLFIMCTSCNSLPKDRARTLFESQKELGFGKALNDSLTSIIFNPKSITCEFHSESLDDTLRHDTVAKVPEELVTTFLYLFSNPTNFQSNEIVFGHFQTWVSYKIEASKKKTVNIELDFGLRKWRLSDANNKVICVYDMYENNLQFLYFTRLLFPKEKTLALLEANLTAIKK